jgi:hypothetical protein
MSTSLIDYGNGYLIGIGNGVAEGYNSRDVMKIEAYTEFEGRVVGVCKYELMPVQFPTEYKAYYIDRANQLLGFGYLGEWNEDRERFETKYTLLKFDAQNEKFIELFTVGFGNQDKNYDRGVYIDGYMYMLGSGDFKVVAVDLENADAEQTIS